MRKIIQIAVFYFLIFCATTNLLAQEKAVADVDIQLKETLYLKYKKEVQAFNKKDFDALFFEFFQKQNDKQTILSKEEFYTYTIKIATYSEKLGLLYKDQKAASESAKQEWFSKMYSDYLLSKN